MLCNVLGVLGFANSFDLSRPAREHTNRAFETYTMLEWVKSNDLDDILQNMLEEDLVKLSYIKEYLSIETLQDWGISGRRALRVMELMESVDEESDVAIHEFEYIRKGCTFRNEKVYSE